MWDAIIINPMINTLLGIYGLVSNFGLAIIFFTIVVRLITWPLNMQSMKSASSMQELQKSKKYQEIQKKYKDDKQRLQQEQLKLYQEMGINPLGSCLPMLLQFPIIIGLYQAIIRALAVTPVQLMDLSGHIYPFINATRLIPLNNEFLWMDLSQPERLQLPFLPFPIPVLAIVVVITTYMQSKVMTPPPAPTADGSGGSAAQMAQTMNLTMPLLMGYLALTFASGLALYFVVSNVFSVVQYMAMGKANWRNLLPKALVSKRKG